jgi:hypothetical protein
MSSDVYKETQSYTYAIICLFTYFFIQHVKSMPADLTPASAENVAKSTPLLPSAVSDMQRTTQNGI